MTITSIIALAPALALTGAFGLGDLDDIVDVVTSDEVQSAIDIAEAFREAGRELSDSEEYYLGRAVAANILSMYSPVDCPEFQDYLNRVGQAVALSSPTPALYGGWHFMLLDSEELNAMACPGGFVFICRGLLDLAATEDELACILAHEVSHVSLQHGVKSVESAKWVDAFTLLGTEAASQYGSDEIRDLTDNFGDIASDITSSLITKGYSRTSETEADQYAVLIAAAAGYDPSGLVEVLERMSDMDNRSGPGFWQTHPSPEDRLDDVEETLDQGDYPAVDAGPSPVRDARFQEMTALLDSAPCSSESTASTGRGGTTTTSPESESPSESESSPGGTGRGDTPESSSDAGSTEGTGREEADTGSSGR